MAKISKEIIIEKMHLTKTTTDRDRHHLIQKIVECAKMPAMIIIKTYTPTTDSLLSKTSTKEEIRTQVVNLAKTLIQSNLCNKIKVTTVEEDIQMVAVKITNVMGIRIVQGTEEISVIEETIEDTKTEGIVKGLFV